MDKEKPSVEIIKVSDKESAIVFKTTNKAWCPDCDRVTTEEVLRENGCCEQCEANNNI